MKKGVLSVDQAMELVDRLAKDDDFCNMDLDWSKLLTMLMGLLIKKPLTKDTQFMILTIAACALRKTGKDSTVQVLEENVMAEGMRKQ